MWDKNVFFVGGAVDKHFVGEDVAVQVFFTQSIRVSSWTSKVSRFLFKLCLQRKKVQLFGYLKLSLLCLQGNNYTFIHTHTHTSLLGHRLSVEEWGSKWQNDQ